jgi:hypothetical protein
MLYINFYSKKAKSTNRENTAHKENTKKCSYSELGDFADCEHYSK